MIQFIDPRQNKNFAGLQMRRKGRKPTFVHHTVDNEEVLVGEFHYGSASNPNVLPPGKGIKLFLTDPPYNLGFDYGEVSDKRPEEEYHQMMEDIFDSCYEAADDDAHLFIIHYPQDLAKMWPRLTKKWRFHQWINWNYPANFGHSSKRWTNASRTILWLVKGDPEFYGDRVVQPYRNPTDRRIRKLIHEEGKIGTSLYNWWEVNLCKNVSKDKKEYSNQIPKVCWNVSYSAQPTSAIWSQILSLEHSQPAEQPCALDVMRGMRYPEVIQWRPTSDEFVPADSEQQYDQEYPFTKYKKPV